MSWKESPQSIYKSIKSPQYSIDYHGLYFDLQLNTSYFVFLSVIPMLP